MKVIEGGWPAGATFDSTFSGGQYYEQGAFEEELEKIWFKTWLLAGREEETPRPGDYLNLQVGSESLVCTRSTNGTVQTFYNVCRHRGSRLCDAEKGHFSKGYIICPYHSWMYSGDTGELLSAPNVPEEDQNFDKENHGLHQVKTEVWDGFVWINLDPDAPSLKESFQLPQSWALYEKYHMNQLKIGETKSYEVDANWKLLMENAAECYHCPNIHPELSRCTPPTRPRHWNHENMPETETLHHYGAMEVKPGFERANIDGKVYRPVFPDLNVEDQKRVYYFHIFPLSYMALASDHVFFLTLWPTKPDKTLVKAYWLFDPEVLRQENCYINDAVQLWDRTNQEDWEACERVQAGNQSRMYENGGTLTPLDWRVANFKNYVQSILATQGQVK